MRSALVVVGLLIAGCPSTKPPPEHPITVTTATPDAAPPPSTAAGLVPPEPTLRLPKNFVPTGYHAQLAIDPAATGFDGTIQITGTVAQRSSAIWLHARHLKIASAVASQGDPFEKRHAMDVHLTASAHGEDLVEFTADKPIDPGTWTLTIAYAGEYDLLNTAGAFKQVVGKEAYVFSQFEAVYARRAFPCVDEPDSKVPWQLTITVPRGNLAVANTPEVKAEETEGPDAKHVRFEFGETKPLPAYLVAFGVGPFDVVDAGKTKGGTPVRIIALKGRAADAAYAAKTSAPVLELVETWFGMPYPYPKLDFLTIPITVGFSAMENAGLISFAESDLLFDTRASKERLHRWIFVSAHEIAHQWFGDLVTMAWWDDIWLNEGFANWLEHKISAKFEPSWHDELSDVGTHRGALDDDALATARRVRQPIEKPGDILTAFDGITYNKGQSVLDMFENFVGADKFREGIRTYLAAKQYGTATSQDFVGAISKVAGRDLGPAFSTFLDQPGEPELVATLDCTKPKAPAIQLAQHRYLPPGAAAASGESKPWIVPVCAAYDADGKRGEACTLVEGATATLALPAGRCPRWAMTNANAKGYYRTQYTAAQLAGLRDEAWPQLTWAERMSVAWEARSGALVGRQPLALAMSFVPKLLAGDDRFTVGDASAIVRELEDWIPDDQRAKWEQWLRAMFGPAMTQVGLVGKPSEEIDAEKIRNSLVGIVGWHGKDPKVIDEAVKLFDGWRDLPGGTRLQVLELALDAKPELFARALDEAAKEPERSRRRDLIHALAVVRDPKREVQALNLVLDPKLDIRETVFMLLLPTTPASKIVAQKFFKEHAQAILARIPTDETADPIAELGEIFTSSCDGARRDEIATYVTATFGKLGGGERVIAQQLEEMDQCVAARKLVEPELRGWLSGVKIVKAAPPPAKTPAKTPPKKSGSHRP